MNANKLQSVGISVYRSQFQPSQNNRTYSSRVNPPLSKTNPKENEFEEELKKALEGFDVNASSNFTAEIQ